jgi:hypothetical protein
MTFSKSPFDFSLKKIILQKASSKENASPNQKQPTWKG